MRRSFIGSLLIVSLSSLPAHADVEIPERPDAHYSVGDWAASFFIGNAAGAIGALAGGAIGYAAAGDCESDAAFGCLFHGWAPAALGGGLGLTFGGAAGVYAYGELSGHDGNYWAAAGGFAIGLAASLGLSALFADTEADSAIAYGTLFTLPVLGGTLGYVLTLDDGDDVTRHGALLELDGGTLRLGMPDVGVTLGADARVERVDVRLIGGTF